MHKVAGLLGRQDEQRQLMSVLADARHGRGGAVLIRGEPGMGKSALLDTVAAQAVRARVLRVDGVDAESTIPFAAIQRLLIPLRPMLVELPPRHTEVLRIAMGESAGPPPERFLVGLALLQLSSLVAQDAPLVCLVDDAHLLDVESLDALAFVARRLEADAVAIVFAGRDEAGLSERLRGIPDLSLSGLDLDAGVRLLTLALGAPIDPAAAVKIVQATGGVPLALIDLAEELSTRELSDLPFAGAPVPIGRHLEQHYLEQVHRTDPDVQQWALVAAADPSGSPALVQAAAEHLGLAADAGDRAETAGLVKIDDAIRFRHALVRAAIYNGATGSRRRTVHAALSRAAARASLVEVDAWHAARAAVAPAPEVAARLEHTADRAGVRGGLASRATVLARAAELTPPGPERDRRWVGAAEAALAAGAAGVSADHLSRLDGSATTPVVRARATVVSAALRLFAGDPAVVTAPAELLTAARLCHGLEPRAEQSALLRAFETSLVTERHFEGITLDELGARLDAGAEAAEGTMSTVLRGLGSLTRRPYAEAVPAVRSALAEIAALPDRELMQLGSTVVALSTYLWDADSRAKLLGRAARAAVDDGALQALDTVLWLMSLVELHGGSVRRATERLDQLRELRRSLGYETEQVVNGALLAWLGAPREAALAVAASADAVGFGGVSSLTTAAVATLDLAEGQYGEAYQRLKPLVDEPFLQATMSRYGDFVEAATRSGHAREALPVAAQLTRMADVNGSRWCRGVALRSTAMVSDDATAETLLRDSVACLEDTTAVVELARGHLVLGEWLRRARRRREAREHLDRAVAHFHRGGAGIFLARAGAELEALGGSIGAAGPSTLPALTAQELAVARLAAAGHTNVEIGDRMFISRNTVDYHLRKVFQKLAITSRRQLSDVLGRLPG